MTNDQLSSKHWFGGSTRPCSDIVRSCFPNTFPPPPPSLPRFMMACFYNRHSPARTISDAENRYFTNRTSYCLLVRSTDVSVSGTGSTGTPGVERWWWGTHGVLRSAVLWFIQSTPRTEVRTGAPYVYDMCNIHPNFDSRNPPDIYISAPLLGLGIYSIQNISSDKINLSAPIHSPRNTTNVPHSNSPKSVPGVETLRQRGRK